MRVLSLIILFVIAAPLHHALGSNFKVTAPVYWAKSAPNREALIYKNTRSRSNETIITQTLVLRYQDDSFQSSLADKKKQLTGSRAFLMSKFGIANYQVIDIEQKKLTGSKFDTAQIIHSRFVDLEGREVQMFEKQYVKKRQMYVVTYLVDGPALNDRERVNNIIAFFQPLYKDERSLSSTSDLGSAPASGARGGDVGSSDVKPPTPVKDLDMRSPENQELCASVPVERRRVESDTPFLSGVKTVLSAPRNCFNGAANNLWEGIKGVGQILWSGAQYLNPFSSDYRDQVNAMIGVIYVEINKSPDEFASRVAAEVWNRSAGAVAEFKCLNTSEQIRVVCSVASNLIPAGLLLKVVSKAPLAATEAAMVAQIAKEAVGVTSQVKMVGQAVEDAKAVHIAADGSRVHEFESGISVKVIPDKPVEPPKAITANTTGINAPGAASAAASANADAAKPTGGQPNVETPKAAGRESKTDTNARVEPASKSEPSSGEHVPKEATQKSQPTSSVASTTAVEAPRNSTGPVSAKGKATSDMGGQQASRVPSVGFADQATPVSLPPTMKQTVARVASTGKPDANGDLIRAVASYEGTVADFKGQLLSTSSLSKVEKDRVAAAVQASAAKAREIRKNYPELANLMREDEGRIISLISRLEEKGVSREKIRSEMKKVETQCSIR